MPLYVFNTSLSPFTIILTFFVLYKCASRMLIQMKWRIKLREYKTQNCSIHATSHAGFSMMKIVSRAKHVLLYIHQYIIFRFPVRLFSLQQIPNFGKSTMYMSHKKANVFNSYQYNHLILGSDITLWCMDEQITLSGRSSSILMLMKYVHWWTTNTLISSFFYYFKPWRFGMSPPFMGWRSYYRHREFN
jgi:hypothetical protein